MAQSEQTVDTTPRGQDIQQNNASLGKVLFIYFGILTDSVQFYLQQQSLQGVL